MNIRTIEYNFEYPVKEIIQRIVDDYKEQDELTMSDLEFWLKVNHELIGEYFIDQIDLYCGFDEIIEKIHF